MTKDRDRKEIKQRQGKDKSVEEMNADKNENIKGVRGFSYPF